MAAPRTPVLEVLDLERRVLGWPDPEQRSGNLDALRALADRYEETCRVTGAAASLAGMLHYFDQAREERWDGSEMRATDEQHFSQGPGAVVLCTYHRAKGLEWPVVILSSLDAVARDDAFGVKIQSSGGELDPARPLDGRWIRYFPRPLAGRKSFGLAEREALSPQGLEAREEELRERARLLYVGFTRARDHLILVARNKKGKLEPRWLDELRGNDGLPLLRLPAPTDSSENQSLAVAGTSTRVEARVWEIDLEPTHAEAMNDTTEPLAWRRPPLRAPRQSYWITPSSAAESWQGVPALRTTEAVRVGPPLRVARQGTVDWAAFGNTVHAFLTADRGQQEPSTRHAVAHRLRLRSECRCRVTDRHERRLAPLCRRKWPGAIWHREIPIRVRIGSGDSARRVNGEIDLLLETDTGYVVIDHKTYGNPDETAVRQHAERYLPQLAAYGRALETLGGKPVLGYWLHFGIAGICLRCEPLAHSAQPPR